MRLRFPLQLVSWSFCFSFLTLTHAALAQIDKAIYVTPIPNVPFTAVVNVDHTGIARDGTKTSFKLLETIARDTRGRMYRDVWTIGSATRAGTPQLLTVCFYDPKTKIYTVVDAQFRTFWSGTLDHRPEVMGAGFFYDDPLANQFADGEDLGTQTMAGVSVHGVRKTENVSAGAGNRMVTREYWYSDDLKMNLVARHADPHAVMQTMTVAQLKRSDPDAAIFDIPAGYRRVGNLFRLYAPLQ
jgi:hypothetical protein